RGDFFNIIMLRRVVHSLALVSGVLALVSLVTLDASAQKKKPPAKKPAATTPAKGKHKPAPQPAPAPAPTPAPAPPQAAPAPAPSRTKRTTRVVAPPPVEEETPPPDEKPVREEKHETRFGPLFELGLGVHAFQRHLRYEGDRAGVLPPYDLNGAPAGALLAEV